MENQFTLHRVAMRNIGKFVPKDKYIKQNYLDIVDRNFDFTKIEEEEPKKSILINRKIPECTHCVKFFDDKAFVIKKNKHYKAPNYYRDKWRRKNEGDNKKKEKREGDKRKNLPFYLRDYY